MTKSAHAAAARIQFSILPSAGSRREELAELGSWLRRNPPQVPPRWLYDDVGSRLFEEICRLPEYYPTRTEAALLRRKAGELVRRTGARELVELGSGDGRKTRILLAEMLARGPATWVPFEISEATARRAARELARELDGLRVKGFVGDFTRALPALPDAGPRLIAFLGGTVGNFEPEGAARFLKRVAAAAGPGDWLLLGVDLIKDPARLEAAYDDAAGVTARFDLNLLSVLNREAGGDFDRRDFRHRAVWDAPRHRIEMHLVARRTVRARLEELDLDLVVREGEHLRTEISTKYDRRRAERLLAASRFRPVAWYPDPARLFALVLARREGVSPWRVGT